ncbi:hypothetical protein FB106_12033 [Synechococcus sp. Ace-Pa]|nr:hypothetical protein FB106_12033 [Synechococcus sp. Ace-Pa]
MCPEHTSTVMGSSALAPARTVERCPVSERALLARINRNLAGRGQSLRRCRRDSLSRNALGRHFLLDFRSNRVLEAALDLESWARSAGFLQAYEALSDV